MRPANLETPSIHKRGPKPTARLVACTPDPLFTVWYAWHFSRDQDFTDAHGYDPDVTRNSRVMRPSDKELEQFFKQAISEWAPVTELVHFTFACSNVPRALLDQMTRHRLWTFFVQSMRVANMADFYLCREFFIPDAVTEVGREAEEMYDDAMKDAAAHYRKLLGVGVPIEDARGVLPLHCNTRLIVGCNMRAFKDAVQKRTCWILQQQYWAPLLASMRNELVMKVHPMMAELFAAPCELPGGKCLTWIEQEYRMRGEDPNPPCPKHPAYKEGRSP